MAPASIDNRLAQSSAGDRHRPPCVRIMLDDAEDSVKGELVVKPQNLIRLGYQLSP